MQPEITGTQLYSGLVFDPYRPDPARVRITDIAHSLALQCRFNGHTLRHYSVAEHSVLVSHAVPPEDAFEALMHDSHEAYCSDLPAPLKAHGELGRAFSEVEDLCAAAVRDVFGLPPTPPPSVKAADKLMLAVERATVMSHVDDDELERLWAPWTAGLDISAVPAEHRPQCWPPELAEAIFLGRFEELRAGRPRQ